MQDAYTSYTFLGADWRVSLGTARGGETRLRLSKSRRARRSSTQSLGLSTPWQSSMRRVGVGCNPCNIVFLSRRRGVCQFKGSAIRPLARPMLACMCGRAPSFHGAVLKVSPRKRTLDPLPRNAFDLIGRGHLEKHARRISARSRRLKNGDEREASD
ncbi:hypothetical protein ANO11243_015880 [Dothideomycetidae sp. 11243]|nr:hypothetical protein ANO11243_015880 [fungal sp. No.11243]